MTMPDRHDAEPRPILGRPEGGPDPVSLFAVPIARATTRPGDPVPVTQTLYRTPDNRYVIRTCLHLGSDPALDACDVMIYADEADLREALSAGSDGLDRALLAAAGLDPEQG